ncbi:MAG: LamG domain-containing protein [Nanoarchaeota archaeon]|nr:LamG domain-containing protein [Nanoarchaeota archaeon]MBU1631823.1 LamG domain-containing protein [Nanoarchaeota archaeon]MBU1876147.1 LamG domain-containing protein [Nanoarchaeota archaeon]
MKNKNLILILYLLILLVFAGMVIAAGSKPIASFVFLINGSGAVNATIDVYVNTTFGSVNPCYVLEASPVATGSDGSFSTNLANLKRNDNGADCSGLWATGDPIWAEADGSTVIPVAQGNGSISGDTIASGTGLQMLSNMTLASPPDTNPPIISLTSPDDGNTSTTGNVVFEYNVTDASNITNCKLIFNGTVNETETSIQKNITQNFTITNLPNGHYNWSVNCTDDYGNQNTSEFRLLNISKIGYLQATLITPTSNTNVPIDEFFEFTSQVSCLNGKCGDVNASLDPVSFPQEEDVSIFISALNFLIGIFGSGGLVPTTPTDPFWTNSSNPANAGDFPCLGNMQEGSSCNTTWWVNASGDIGNMSEFFAYYNSTTYASVNNETEHINITIVDDEKPSVIDITPTPSSINQTQTTNITANITDNVEVDNATINITYSNSSTFNYQMIKDGGDIWYYEFTPLINYPSGTYTVRIIANDTSNNINNTETSSFTVSDVTNPNVTLNSPTDNYANDTADPLSVTFNCSVTDNYNLTNISLYITNSNNLSFSLNQTTSLSGASGSAEWTVSLGNGNYTWNCLAYDSDGNNGWGDNNRSVKINYTSPPVDNSPYWSNNQTSIMTTYSSTTQSLFNITWQDDSSVSTVWFESNYSGGAVNYSMNNIVGDVYNYSTILPAGTHYWKSYANDTINQWNQSNLWTFTIAKASSSCTLDVSSSPVSYGTQTQANCSCDNPEVAAVLYRNGTDVTATENGTSVTLPGGNWNYICNVSETQNYTSVSNTNWINITTAATSTTLYINGSTTDFTKNVTFDANITCVLNISDNVNITQNGTQITYGASSLQNISTYSTTGNYSINCSYAGNQNYSASSDNSVISAVDQISPTTILNSPADNYVNDTSDPLSVTFNCSATDNYNLANISLYITNNQNTSFTLNQTTSISGTSNSTTWSLSLGNGNYTWNCLVYDNAGQSDWGDSNRSVKINYTAPAAAKDTPLLNLTFNGILIHPYGGVDLPDNKGAEDQPYGANMSENVLLYHMDETSGKIVDYSGEGNNGSAFGGVTYQSNGQFDKALLFDGYNDYIYAGFDDSLRITDDITFGTWARLDSVNDDAHLISFGAHGEMQAANLHYVMGLSSTGDIYIGHEYNSGLDEIQYFDTNLNLAQWYYLVAVRDYSAKTWKLYINGQQFGSTFTYSYQSNGGDTSALRVGGNPSDIYYDGKMDEVFISNRVLSDQEILNHYRRGAGVRNITIDQGDSVTIVGSLEEGDNSLKLYKDETEIQNSSTSPITNYSIYPTPGIFTINFTAEESSNYYADSIWGQIIVLATDTTSPNVTLNSPADNYYNDTSNPVNVTFNCSATDNVYLMNISLYITNSNNQSFSFNQTTSLSGTSGSAQWILSLGNGNYSWNCLASDGGGYTDWGDANRSIMINYTPDNNPITTLSLPEDNYYNDTSDPADVTFECNATDDNSLTNISLYITNNQNTSFALNQTTSISGTSNSTRWNLSLVNGNYTWNCLAYDNAGQSDWGDSNRTITINYTAPDYYPYWSNNQTSIVTTYSSTTQSLFNITWQDDNNVSSVWFESNFSGSATNYSMNLIAGNTTNGTYNYSTILPAGTHYWKSYANDSANQWNQTDQWSFTIAQITSTCSLAFDQTSPQNYSTQINASCSCTNAESSATLYRNNTDVTSTENNQLTTLPAGTWNYTCNVSSIQNYTSASNSSLFIINQLASQVNLTLNNSKSNITVQNGTVIDLNCSLTTGEGSIYLYNNGSLINSGSSPLGNSTTFNNLGLYNITCLYSETQNYSSSSETYWVNVESSPTVTLNSPADNYNNDTSDPVNVTFNCSAIDGTGLINISLYITDSTNQSFVLNQTTSISGTSNSTSWTLSLVNGNYTWNCLAYDTSGYSDWGDSNRSIMINYTMISSNLIITLNSDNSSADLNWTNVTDADSYVIYYSNDLEELININLSNVSSVISNISGITGLNWTDWNAADNQTRYYRISVVRGSSENISDDVVGKHTYYLKGNNYSGDAHTRKNWVGLALDAAYDAEMFIQNVPYDRGIRIKKLNRPDNGSYNYITHNKGENPNNFTMRIGEGYEVEVREDANYTIVGDAIVSLTSYELFGTASGSNDNYRRNWISIGYTTNITDAETFLQGISNNYGIKMKWLNRADSISYSYINHDKSGSNNFTLYVGRGYEVEVNGSVNYTLT